MQSIIEINLQEHALLPVLTDQELMRLLPAIDTIATSHIDQESILMQKYEIEFLRDHPANIKHAHANFIKVMDGTLPNLCVSTSKQLISEITTEFNKLVQLPDQTDTYFAITQILLLKLIYRISGMLVYSMIAIWPTSKKDTLLRAISEYQQKVTRLMLNSPIFNISERRYLAHVVSDINMTHHLILMA